MLSTSTNTYVPSNLSTSTNTEIRYSSTTSMSTKYSGPNPGVNPGSCWACQVRDWPEILHADVSSPLLELIRFCSWSVDFPPFGVTLTWWNRSNLWFQCIYMLMYPDHLQCWLDFCHGLLIFLILALLWLSERGQFVVSGHFPENAWREWPEI